MLKLVLKWAITIIYKHACINAWRQKGCSYGLQSHLILKVLHRISIFIIEIFSIQQISPAWLCHLPLPLCACMHVRVDVCTYIRMHACTYACMHVYNYVCFRGGSRHLGEGHLDLETYKTKQKMTLYTHCVYGYMELFKQQVIVIILHNMLLLRGLEIP